MKNIKLALVGLCVSFSALAAYAQQAEQQKLLARRAAQADAYRQLAECVYGLQINSTTLVQDFVTESDEIRSDVDQFIRGVRFGDARWYEDGSCEIPAEVTVAKVIQTLKESHSRHYQGDRVKATDFESMTTHIQKDVINVVGMGAPREDLPPDLPEGVVELLPGPPPASAPSMVGVWKNVPARARLMARRAAELDAKRQLAERIKGLRLTSNTYVRDFVTENDEIRTGLDATLVGSRVVKEYYHHDELIAEVTVAVPTEQVITTIKSLHSRHYRGDTVKATDIEKISTRIKRKTFEATGMGIPPAKYMGQAAVIEVAETTISIPDWAASPIRATGQGTDPDIGSAQGCLKAKRAAELDAKRKLAEQLGGLQISSETYVRDFVTEHDEISSSVDALMIGAQVRESHCSGDMAEATVELNGARVWSVIGPVLRRSGL